MTVQTRASACCVLQQDTLSALLHNLVKGVQCHVFFEGIALKNHAFFYLHSLLDLLLHLLTHNDPITFLIHDSTHIIIPNVTSSILTQTQPSIFCLIHLPTISLQSNLNPIHSIDIPFKQYFNIVGLSSPFSHIVFKTLFFALFFMPLYQFL